MDNFDIISKINKAINKNSPFIQGEEIISFQHLGMANYEIQRAVEIGIQEGDLPEDIYVDHACVYAGVL